MAEQAQHLGIAHRPLLPRRRDQQRTDAGGVSDIAGGGGRDQPFGFEPFGEGVIEGWWQLLTFFDP
ncbi:hypothetical protein [Erythrobacter litoralis]|nr:hypothetical protein [Erythrobacter litoralis]